MRCTSHCVAKSINISRLARHYKAQKKPLEAYHDVLHLLDIGDAHAFIFKQGTCVLWGLTKHEEREILALIRDYTDSAYPSDANDQFSFRLDEKTSLLPHDYYNIDVITLESDDSDIKLALSYALSQSVRLNYLENTIEELITENANIPESLAKSGKLGFSNKAIQKKLAQIHLAKAQINLKTDLLNTPHFFWSHPGLETYHEMARHYMDIATRVSTLNHKLDLISDVLDMLNNQLQHRTSSFLEWIIILLIAIEIVFMLIFKG